MLLILAATCLFWVDAGSSLVPSDLERAQILEFHLRVRESVQPPASHMKLLRYSKHLESLAVRWANRCVYGHPKKTVHKSYAGTGQSIARYYYRNPSFVEAACIWLTEDRFYKYATNTCTHFCNHYRQMLWENTTEIGCAVQHCYEIRKGVRVLQHFAVCQYFPEGNLSAGRPYRSGESCSGCSRDQWCYRNQCVDGATQCDSIYPLMGFTRTWQRQMPRCLVDPLREKIEYT